jgi:hypothetical protein
MRASMTQRYAPRPTVAGTAQLGRETGASRSARSPARRCRSTGPSSSPTPWPALPPTSEAQSRSLPADPDPGRPSGYAKLCSRPSASTTNTYCNTAPNPSSSICGSRANGSLHPAGSPQRYSKRRGIWDAHRHRRHRGYGDFVPVTPTGRFLVASLLMLGAIGLVGSITATLASWIVEHVADEKTSIESKRQEDLVANIDKLHVEFSQLTEELRRHGIDPSGHHPVGDG